MAKESKKPWHEQVDYHWTKVWDRWWSSESHRGLDIFTLGLGLWMMNVANRRGREADGSGWVLGTARKPLEARTISAMCLSSRNKVVVAIQKLVDAGTISVRSSDGAYGFSNLREWQESPSAAKMRRHRDGHSDRNSDRQDDQTIRGSKDPSERPPPKAPKPKKPALVVDPILVARATRVIALWNDHTRETKLPHADAFGELATRDKNLVARLRDHPERDEQWWATLFIDVANDPSQNGTRSAWRTQLHWLVANEENLRPKYNQAIANKRNVRPTQLRAVDERPPLPMLDLK